MTDSKGKPTPKWLEELIARTTASPDTTVRVPKLGIIHNDMPQFFAKLVDALKKD